MLKLTNIVYTFTKIIWVWNMVPPPFKMYIHKTMWFTPAICSLCKLNCEDIQYLTVKDIMLNIHNCYSKCVCSQLILILWYKITQKRNKWNSLNIFQTFWSFCQSQIIMYNSTVSLKRQPGTEKTVNKAYLVSGDILFLCFICTLLIFHTLFLFPILL